MGPVILSPLVSPLTLGDVQQEVDVAVEKGRMAAT